MAQRGAAGGPPAMGAAPSSTAAGTTATATGAGVSGVSSSESSVAAGGVSSGAAAQGTSSMPSAGGMGMGGGSVSTALVNYLTAHRGSAKYLVAATGSQSTASIIIKTGQPVVTIGGFSGSDNAPTAQQLAAMVAAGELHYVLIGGGGPGGGQSAITAWVQSHGTVITAVQAGNGTLYKVTA
jgi:hypothetical protein